MLHLPLQIIFKLLSVESRYPSPGVKLNLNLIKT